VWHGRRQTTLRGCYGNIVLEIEQVAAHLRRSPHGGRSDLRSGRRDDRQRERVGAGIANGSSTHACGSRANAGGSRTNARTNGDSRCACCAARCGVAYAHPGSGTSDGSRLR